MRLTILFLLVPLISFSQELINAVAMKNGGRIITSAPSSRISSPHTAIIDDYSVQALTDESPIMWCSKSFSSFPLTFVYELSEEYLLEKFTFNTICENYKGIAAKNVRVEVSTISATKGFETAGEYTLNANTINTFTLPPVKARWVKLVILSNHGNNEFTELAEFEAWGKFADPSYEEMDIVGLWDSNFDWVSINSNKNGFIYGCYKWAQGDLYAGEVNRRIFTFSWKQRDDGQKGWCRLAINKEGNILFGIWGYDNDYNRFGFWEFTKNSSTPKTCWNDKEVEDQPSTRIDKKPEPVEEVVKTEPVKEINKVYFVFEDKETKKPLPAELKLELNGEI
ncbi:MAG TPA: discoidin domain-containing protein, partial [Cytophagaceae bacterium]